MFPHPILPWIFFNWDYWAFRFSDLLRTGFDIYNYFEGEKDV
jgi:hypothetical protein